MRRLLTVPLALSVALAACSGGSGVTAPPVATTPTGTTPLVTAASGAFSYDTATLGAATLQHRAQLQGYGFDVSLQLADLPGLVRYAQSVSDPASPSYRHFLTPQEIGGRFGAPAATVAAAERYLASYGLSVAAWPQNLMLHVSGSQPALEAAFHTAFGVYALDGASFVGPESAPAVPPNLGILGSADIVTPRSFEPYVDAETSPLYHAAVGLAPQQVAAAFDFDGAYAAGYTGKGIKIGVIGTGPIAVTGVGGITLGDLDATRALFGVGGSSTVVLPPVGDAAAASAGKPAGYTSPPPVTAPGATCDSTSVNPANGQKYSESPTATCNPEDHETEIDVESTGLLAPDATIEYYLGYNPNGCSNGTVAPATCAPGNGYPQQGLLASTVEIQQAIADDTADVLSLSFGTVQTSVPTTQVASYASPGQRRDRGLRILGRHRRRSVSEVRSRDDGQRPVHRLSELGSGRGRRRRRHAAGRRRGPSARTDLGLGRADARRLGR